MKYLSVFVISILLFTSCNIIDMRRISGNGKIVAKDYNLKGFKSIDVGGAIEVYVKQDSSFKVKVETDENIMQYLRIEVIDGLLEIGHKDHVNLDPSDKIKISISMPVLKGVTISGASSIKGEGKIVQNEELSVGLSGASDGDLEVRVPRVSIDVSGASTLKITGETKDIKAEATGASTIKGYDLKSENADVNASGASTANVFASVSLTGDASGASGIHYKGNPAKNNASASGASNVTKED
jgi:hypothetical protein